ncbi:MAG: HNH endonuclease [Thermomicrobiales bacterium]
MPGHDLTDQHKDALEWFAQHQGEIIPFGDLQALGLTTKAKGIYKPSWMDYVLSVRHVPESAYGNSIHDDADSWSLQYHEERPRGRDPRGASTNIGLLRCLEDRIPIGVLERHNPKPDARYLVRGLADVAHYSDGVFLLRAASVDKPNSEALELESLGDPSFDPSDLADGREQTLRAMAVRRGQASFRASLIRAYAGRCAVTGCSVTHVLEAAHIIPYRGVHTNHVTNGLLLRSDIHSLFDLGVISIDEQGLIRIAEALHDSEYAIYEGQPLTLPGDPDRRPNREALQMHFDTSDVGTQRNHSH